MRSWSLALLLFAALVRPGLSDPAPAPADAKLTPRALKCALDDFKAALDQRWSYRHANDADFDGAIAALRRSIHGALSADQFGVELQKIIALGLDGHAGVSGYTLPPGGHLPFLVESQGERFVAFNQERTAFLADGSPFLTQLDGRDIADWCKAAAVLVPKGSPQYGRRHCLARLRDLDLLRGLMALPKRDTVEIALAAADGTRRTLTLPVAHSSPRQDAWPRSGSRLLDGNVGYLRLPNMDETASVQEITQWMPRFRETAGLVVDVRDNTGGERDALRLLYSYLADPDDPPRVVNVAAYRLHPAYKKDHLAQHHFMYRADAEVWTAEERRAIAALAKTFRPEWPPPKGQFSDWHYMVLRRFEDPPIYHYDRAVIVLMNARCFSATDVFLAGLKGMRNVTLLGTPSAGGSAFGQEVSLGATPLRVRIGSMASFQTDGSLFDGHGVRPDVVAEPMPEYQIGGPDTVLAAAVTRLTGK